MPRVGEADDRPPHPADLASRWEDAPAAPSGADPLATVKEVFPGRLLGFTPRTSRSDAEDGADAERNDGLFDGPTDSHAHAEQDLEEA